MKASPKTQLFPSLGSKLKNTWQTKHPKNLTEVLALALKLTILIWLCGVLFVLPFYNTEGYSYIGTDKADFFHSLSILCIRFFIPFLCGYLLCRFPDLVKALQKKSAHFLKQLCTTPSITELFAFGYGLCILISYLLCEDKEIAIWGETGWFMGLMPQIICLSVFFLLSRFFHPSLKLYILVYPVSAVVFFLGFVNRFGWYIQGFSTPDATRISTIGNINWYCAYALTIFSTCFAIKLYWDSIPFSTSHSCRLYKYLLDLYLLIGFATLMNQGSFYGYIIIFFLFLLQLYLAADSPLGLKRLSQEFLILSLSCIISYMIQILQISRSTYEDSIVYLMTWSFLPPILLLISLFFRFITEYQVSFLGLRRMIRIFGYAIGTLFVAYLCVLIYNSTHDYSISATLGHSGTDLISFTPEWLSGRGGTWRAGYAIYKAMSPLQKIIGVGPDCMYSFYHTSSNQELTNLMNYLYGSRRLTNAHNEVLTILINYGILGAICFVGFFTSLIVRSVRLLRKALSQGKTLPAALIPLLACLLGVISYLTGNITGFEQTMSLPLFYILSGILEKQIRNSTL